MASFNSKEKAMLKSPNYSTEFYSSFCS